MAISRSSNHRPATKKELATPPVKWIKVAQVATPRSVRASGRGARGLVGRRAWPVGGEVKDGRAHEDEHASSLHLQPAHERVGQEKGLEQGARQAALVAPWFSGGA